MNDAILIPVVVGGMSLWLALLVFEVAFKMWLRFFRQGGVE